MVTHAKKPRAPRKKRVTAKDEAVTKAAEAAEPTPPPASPTAAAAATVASVPLEDGPMPKSYQNEPDDHETGSDEPDFGLGIGDILRNDSGIKAAAAARAAASQSPSKSDAKRLSIDSILRGEAEPQMPASLMEDVAPEDNGVVASRFGDDDEEVQAMQPQRRGGAFKSVLMVLLVLALFLAAAGGVYAFLSKNGVPSFLAGLGGSPDPVVPVTNTPSEPEVPAGPVIPENASVTVLVGLKAPEADGGKAFLVTRAIESDGKTSGTFPATGTASSQTDRATGIATIINTTGNSPTYVATTRLLSKEGVLFRLVETTKIPANGSIDVRVRADQPGAEGDIGPTTFTIPGLSPEQQKLIYAKSDAAMTGGSGVGVKGVSQADIDAAKVELAAKLRAEALANFEVMLLAGEKLHGDMVTARELAATVPRVGTAGETFPASVSLRFSAMLMPEKDILPLLETAKAEALPVEVTAADYELGTPHYTVQAYDTAAGVAEVRVDAPIIKR
jgi:hypothetical protein